MNKASIVISVLSMTIAVSALLVAGYSVLPRDIRAHEITANRVVVVDESNRHRVRIGDQLFGSRYGIFVVDPDGFHPVKMYWGERDGATLLISAGDPSGQTKILSLVATPSSAALSVNSGPIEGDRFRSSVIIANNGSPAMQISHPVEGEGAYSSMTIANDGSPKIQLRHPRYGIDLGGDGNRGLFEISGGKLVRVSAGHNEEDGGWVKIDGRKW